MKPEEIKQNIGAVVQLNGYGDLAFSGWLRPWINTDRWLRIVKLTRSGMAYLQRDDGKYEVVPPRNVQEARPEIKEAILQRTTGQAQNA